VANMSLGQWGICCMSTMLPFLLEKYCKNIGFSGEITYSYSVYNHISWPLVIVTYAVMSQRFWYQLWHTHSCNLASGTSSCLDAAHDSKHQNHFLAALNSLTILDAATVFWFICVFPLSEYWLGNYLVVQGPRPNTSKTGA
jgi:hypothetical protein